MKTFLFASAFLVSMTVYGGEANQLPSYTIGERGANHRTWQKVVSITNGLGQIITRTNAAYTELATGMHFQKGQQWIESRTTIDPVPGGAAATNGPHQVYFPANIYNGVIELITSDGQHLKNRPLGLSYFDGSNSVLIAELTNSLGQILPSGNQVIYTNAFTDFAADILGTYRKNGFECDVVLRQRPPPPEEFGLNSQNCWLQLLTEFFDTLDPAQQSGPTSPEQGLQDVTLIFGTLRMGHGKAFSIGQAAELGGGVQVYKSWAHLQGRTFLIEEVPYQSIASQLEEVQASVRSATSIASANAGFRGVSTSRVLSPGRGIHMETNVMRLAHADLSRRSGLVLDYSTVLGFTNDFTFQADTTYFVSAEFDILGTATIEGGTVIKITNSVPGSAVYMDGPIVCQTGPYRPALVTSSDDDSVGDTITGSSGNPSSANTYTALVIDFDSPAFALEHLRISYASQGMLDYENNVSSVRHCQFVSGGTAITHAGNGTGLNVENVLIYKVSQALAGGSSINPIRASHLTVDETDNLIDAFTTLRATNSLFGAVTNWGGPFTGFNNATNNGPSVFVTAGGAKHYLADDSFRNVGTTNISAALLADLKSTTTYPPIVYDIPGSYLSESLTLFPQAQRDYDLPDLGYHYDPLDYLFGGIVLSNVAIVLNPGTAIGLFSTNNLSVGLSLKTNSQFVSEGEAENLNRLVAYDMVQEQTRTGWERPRNLVSCSLQVSPTLMRFRFTDWSVPAGNDVLVNVSCDIGPINFQDCQFHGGMIEMLHPTCNFTNCLFERVNVTIDAEDANVPVIRNNLVYGGMFDFFTVQTNAVIKDNLFDRPVIPDEIGVAGGTYDGGCNAYVMNYDRLQPTNASDRILVSPPTYQAGALGRFYLPTNSPLINWGSVTNAGLVGLYHFTTVTNQLKETNSVVDIGFHYAALNTGSSVISPIDTDGDGVPDYLEDLNGNGLLSSGETDWQSAADLGLKVWITRPRNGSTIP